MDMVKVGTRLSCASCGTEAIVVKAPSGVVACCGRPMDGQEGGA